MAEETQGGNVTVDPAQAIADIIWLSDECDQRCLFECSKWSRETLFHMSDSSYTAYVNSPFSKLDRNASSTAALSRNASRLEFAKSLILSREYRRAKFVLQQANMAKPVEAFLYYFCWYMISVQDRVEADAVDSERLQPFVDSELSNLRHDFERFYIDSTHIFDSFLLYLRGMILKDCDAKDLARDCFYEATTRDHRCWPAWDELSKASDIFYSAKIEKLPIAKTWQGMLYLAETLSRLQVFYPAMERYTHLAELFGASPYIMGQIATAQSDLQEHDSAITSFQRVRKIDPYRVEQMNKFSDSLYIRQNVVELANLSKFFYANHKYAWETCCIVANYYSARGGAEGHDTAQLMLRRALRMNPTNTAIWVLLGHELMELTRNQSAVLAYRRAVAIDPLCYQAWYGLGQLYEILKLPAMALYYYQQAHKCKPADSRMLIALGVILTRLNRISDAEKCFKKAFQIGDMEGSALTHLARLYESQKDMSTAAKAYEAYLGFYNEDIVGDFEQMAEANQFLAKYYLTLDDLDTAYNYAQKCLNYNTSKEEGFRVLRAIMNRRAMEKSKPSSSGVPSVKTTTRRRTDASLSALATVTPATRRRRCSSTATADSSMMNVDEDDESLLETAETTNTPADSSRQRLASTETQGEENDEHEDEEQPDFDDDDDMRTSDDDDVEISY